MMIRRALSFTIVATLLLATSSALMARAEDGHHGAAGPTMAVVGNAPADLELGGRKCFGYGSEGCCSEMVMVGGAAGFTGNALAFALASAYWYVYC